LSSVIGVILCLAVLREHRLVTDGQTDKRTQSHSIYGKASDGNK